MGGTCRNDIKTIFFILNSFMLLVGLALFSSGVGNRALKSMEAIDNVYIVVGLLYIGVALLAYVAASAESDKLHRAYGLVMFIKSILNVNFLALFDKQRVDVGVSPEGFYAGMIVETIITMVLLLLSVTLGVQRLAKAAATADP